MSPSNQLTDPCAPLLPAPTSSTKYGVQPLQHPTPKAGHYSPLLGQKELCEERERG